MVSRHSVTTILFAAAAIAFVAPTTVTAGDWRPRHHQAERHHHAARDVRLTRNFRVEPHDRDRNDRQQIVGGAGLPSILPGIGTYVGAVSAVNVSGNGIYFAVDNAALLGPTVILAPKAKIIHVNFEGDGPACSYEAGVCVIRP
ncbi:MAG: hypothetical protein ACOH2J_10150 [Allorhizobium sp.]